ncbi:MAG: NAD(P)-dependent oxidoreductase [Candidatus Saccharibacteria bacterium]|nr:NAD(P)-dependent oxidoreductase [Microbacteriaceae bacterium]
MTRNNDARNRIGFVGLGHLGKLLAHSLLRAGYELTVHDLSKENAASLLLAGARWAETPRVAAAGNDCVITCLPSPRAVSACLEGDRGVLAGLDAGATWIDMSTNDFTEVQRIANLAAELGINCLEAPVTGGVHTAAVGEITALVGGERECFERHEQLLSAMCKPVLYIGDLGSASTLKVITNMLAFMNQWAAGEALMLAKAAGIDLRRAYDGIVNSSGNSWSFEIETQLVLNGSYDFSFTLDLACKDFGLAYQLGRTLGVPLEVAGHVEQIFQRARATYGGQAWSTQVVKLLEDSMGQDLRAPGFPSSLFADEAPIPAVKIVN